MEFVNIIYQTKINNSTKNFLNYYHFILIEKNYLYNKRIYLKKDKIFLRNKRIQKLIFFLIILKQT